MKPDYLCDAVGPADPDVEHFERVLRPRRFDRPMPEPGLIAVPARRRFPGRARWWLAAAAVALAAWGGVAWFTPSSPPQAQWQVRSVSGSPAVDNAALGAAGRLSAGQWLVTDGKSKAQLSADGIATIDLGLNSKLRLEKSAPGEVTTTLELAQGRVLVTTEAAPRTFVIRTPVGRVVDLGCEYEVDVEPDGATRVHVRAGRVELECAGKSAMIPHCGFGQARPGRGLGTPWFDDATPRLAAAVATFDFEQGGDHSLQDIMSDARPRDTLTLWYLLPKVREEVRGRIYDRVIRLVPGASSVARAKILQLDAPAVERLRQVLELVW